MNKITPILLILIIILGITILYVLFQLNKPSLSANLEIGELKDKNYAQTIHPNRGIIIVPGELRTQERRTYIQTETRTQTQTQTQIQPYTQTPQYQYPIYQYPTTYQYPAYPQNYSTYYVHIKNNAFYPFELRVQPGTRIVWINEDFIDHTVTGGILQSPRLAPGARYETVINQRGVYDYICTLHPNMRGRIIVN